MFPPGVLTPWVEDWTNERNLLAKGAILSGNAPEQVGTFADLQSSVDVIVSDLDRTLGPGARVQFLTIEAAQEFMFYQGARQSLSFAYPYAATVFMADVVTDARAMLDDGYYLLMDDIVAQTASAAGLSMADYAYETTLGSYHLIGKLAPPSR